MNEELHRQQVNKAVAKYHQEKLDNIIIHVPKGRREYYKGCAAAAGESLNKLTVRALDELIEREGLRPVGDPDPKTLPGGDPDPKTLPGGDPDP